MSNIGNILQIFAMCANIILVIVAAWYGITRVDPGKQRMDSSLRRNDVEEDGNDVVEGEHNTVRGGNEIHGRWDNFLYLFYVSSSCIVLAFLTLIYSFVISDFSLLNVFLHSSTIKPLIFKIAGSWSSHEGSMLLWLCLLCLVSVIYVYFSKQRNKIYRAAILALLQLLFGSFIYFTSNSLEHLSFTPAQGLGLNPMLQDIALAIHPPILYLGYVSYVIPFIISCSMLLSTRALSSELLLLKIFSGIGTLFTIIGIALGSWWAYRELGWGGFWFFDPVENISLFPFLSGIALYHCALVSNKTGRMLHWTIILSIISFVLVVFSTLLVRSGYIVSIHSFAESPARAIYMFIILMIITSGSLGLLIVRWPRVRDSFYSKEEGQSIVWTMSQLYVRAKTSDRYLGIILGNICFLGSLIMLISATLYPVLYSLLRHKTIIINSEFFTSNFLVFAIPILMIMGLFATSRARQKHILTLTLSGIMGMMVWYEINCGVTSGLIIISSIFLILQNVYFIIDKTNYFQIPLQSSTVAMILGHVGIGMLALSITLNVVLQKDMDFIGKVGEVRQMDGFKVTLRNVKLGGKQNYYRQIAELWLEGPDGVVILKPENRFYMIEKTLSQESDIYSYLTHDLYAVLSKIDDEVIHAKIYYQPMMNIIWLSVMIIVSGFLIGLVSRK